MKPSIDLKWQDYRYFPYEKRLALREVKMLLGAKPKSTKTGLRLTLGSLPPNVLERLTYFREIRLNGTAQSIPFQARLEASALTKQSRYRTQAPSQDEMPVLTRQSTRYSAHGLHEYRGKFNPQIVRAIGNLLQLPHDAWVLDPFCGSGTCLLECAHVGWNAVGIDLNPLGVFISNAKLEAMRVDTTVLAAHVQRLVNRLNSKVRGLDLNKPLSALGYTRLRAAEEARLPNRAYLEGWFAVSVLAQLECIEGEIRRLESSHVRSIAQVVLSDCLRIVSWQDPGDLRIRRRKDPRQNYPLVPLFTTALAQRTAAVIRARAVIGRVRGVHRAVLGDSRQGLPNTAPRPHGRMALFDCIITSPPYATALPYIDTQRLSLAFLGLVQEEGIRCLERSLIGNREISFRERDVDEGQIDKAAGLLPQEVLAICRLTRRLVLNSNDGFRRQNVPALLFRYFRDMSQMFASTLPLVRPGGSFALVVGPNRTTLAGREIQIETPRLLAMVAQHVGWHLTEIFPLDAYQRFDLHQKNSIRKEALVILRRPRKDGRQ